MAITNETAWLRGVGFGLMVSGIVIAETGMVIKFLALN